jgi:hypothetical protein
VVELSIGLTFAWLQHLPANVEFLAHKGRINNSHMNFHDLIKALSKILTLEFSFFSINTSNVI